MSPKNLAYYLSLNYPIELIRDGGVFVASHPDLPGCVSQGDSADDAIANLDDAREAWLAVRVEDNLFIAEPINEQYSGRLSLRMTASLHASLVDAAQREGVSLNSYIVTAVAERHGASVAIRRAEDRFSTIQTAIETSLASLTSTAQIGHGLQRSSSLLSNQLTPLTGHREQRFQGSIGNFGFGGAKTV